MKVDEDTRGFWRFWNKKFEVGQYGGREEAD
jgi:hypothetical protein